MKTTVEIAWKAWMAEQTVLSLCWSYLPDEMWLSYLRGFYWARLTRAVEQLAHDSGPLAATLIELMELMD